MDLRTTGWTTVLLLIGFVSAAGCLRVSKRSIIPEMEDLWYKEKNRGSYGLLKPLFYKGFEYRKPYNEASYEWRQTRPVAPSADAGAHGRIHPWQEDGDRRTFYGDWKRYGFSNLNRYPGNSRRH